MDFSNENLDTELPKISPRKSPRKMKSKSPRRAKPKLQKSGDKEKTSQMNE